MCGIAGIIHQRGDYSLDVLGDRMQTALQHRGPDDQGTYLCPSGQAALIHTRLAILDLSPAGHQPMATADQRYWISFNGEIYNFRHLRAQLEAQGETFCSQTDTEVILKLYQRQGPDCLSQLRGMFAFAIWDAQEKTCFIARDPLGIKPLYYWHSGDTLVFASELRALLASGLPGRQLNPAGLYGYLTQGFVSEPDTLLQDIYCLPAGHWLRWQAGKHQVTRYWQLTFGSEPMAPADAVARLRNALLDSIRHHLVSDVPVGIFLSGGIDSTAVTALARQVQGNTLKTYSIAFAEGQWNEAPLAQRVAQTFATDHSELLLTPQLGEALLGKFLQSVDQPSVDGFNTFCVAQLAHAQGAKVVLSGLGGDELFGGYPFFRSLPRLLQAGQWVQRLQPLGNLLGRGLETYGRSPKQRRIGSWLQQPTRITTIYQNLRSIFSPAEAHAILQYYCPGYRVDGGNAGPEPPEQPSLADTLSWLEINRYMGNQLLRDSDVMSMAWGLELRVPLVDRALLEAISAIPAGLRLAPGKHLLTQAVPEVPDWIINRPKRGFVIPFQLWMETSWRQLFDDIPPLPGISLQPWYRRWSLAVLQHWWHNLAA
jgi:asparagine synthase (glutamine-hydrolysing)